jgi:hypothetical protein
MEIKEAINLVDDFFLKRKKGLQPLYYWKKPKKPKKKKTYPKEEVILYRNDFIINLQRAHPSNCLTWYFLLLLGSTTTMLKISARNLWEKCYNVVFLFNPLGNSEM